MLARANSNRALLQVDQAAVFAGSMVDDGNDPRETRAFDRGDRGQTAGSARTSLDQEIRANRSKCLNLAAARRGETIALAAIATPRFLEIVSTQTFATREEADKWLASGNAKDGDLVKIADQGFIVIDALKGLKFVPTRLPEELAPPGSQ